MAPPLAAFSMLRALILPKRVLGLDLSDGVSMTAEMASRRVGSSLLLEAVLVLEGRKLLGGGRLDAVGRRNVLLLINPGRRVEPLVSSDQSR